MAKNILFVLLEFDNWQRGRGWSYTGSYAFIDGFQKNGHRCFLLPAIFGRAPDANDSFIKHAPRLFAGQHFDEAWVWSNHACYNEDFWSWLKDVAPVRISVSLESLNYSPFEHEVLPFLQEWVDSGYASLPHCTHALVPDEKDVPVIVDRFGIPTAQNIFMMPEELVLDEPAPDHNVASFIGSTYFTGSGYDLPKAALLPRNLYLADRRLEGLMDRPHFRLPERNSNTLARFEDIHKAITEHMQDGKLNRAGFDAYVSELIELRRSLFTLLLEGYRLGMANINLPTLVKSYSGRVLETMAACVPSVSWRIPERPQCAEWFKEDEELVLFDSVEELTQKLTRLRNEPQWREHLVKNGRHAVLERYSSRIRCRRYSDWLDHGTHFT
ncbi:MAG TPA: glycosyltransferase [Burkholderiaceae bacterium]|nr:glycosyltransferase [Burkholderiaceae bacterium]